MKYSIEGNEDNYILVKARETRWICDQNQSFFIQIWILTIALDNNHM
jgi:hypothetical protein